MDIGNKATIVFSNSVRKFNIQYRSERYLHYSNNKIIVLGAVIWKLMKQNINECVQICLCVYQKMVFIADNYHLDK